MNNNPASIENFYGNDNLSDILNESNDDFNLTNELFKEDNDNFDFMHENFKENNEFVNEVLKEDNNTQVDDYELILREMSAEG